MNTNATTASVAQDNTVISRPTEGAQPTINVNGKSYIISLLPPELQEFISLYREWEIDLVAAKKTVFKNEAALKALGSEIEARFLNLEEIAAAAVTPENSPQNY